MNFSRRTVLASMSAAACPGAAAGYALKPDFRALSPEKRAEAERIYQKMMAALPYERTQIDGRSAFAEWTRLKALGKGWPVIVGDDEGLEQIADQFTIGDPAVSPSPSGQSVPPPLRSPSEILKDAGRIRFPEDLRKWEGGYQPDELRAPVGKWPRSASVIADEVGISVSLDLTKHIPFQKVHVLFIPVEHGWEAPAYLRWGGWDACPPPEYHVAALRRWHDEFGAELVGINGDRMDLRVKSPPIARTKAISTAREIYHYCPDIVDQGSNTLAVLAATMVIQKWWTLWWD